MTCHQVQTQLSLYLYGELPFSEEEALESHLDACAFCQLAFAREKTWHAAATSEHRDVPLTLLSACRTDLRGVIAADRPVSARWRWPEWLRISPTRWSYQLALGSFLVFLGFAGGRFIDRSGAPDLTGWGANTASLLGSGRVRDIQSRGPNQIVILIDETRERQIVGNPRDQLVRQMLIAGTQDAADAGIRVDSVEMLNGLTGSDVRQALTDRALHDANAAVRLKAVQSLSNFAGDLDTQNALAYVLQHDTDAVIRSQAIDALLAGNNGLRITPELTNTLRHNLLLEKDDYVRARCSELLRAVHEPPRVY